MPEGLSADGLEERGGFPGRCRAQKVGGDTMIIFVWFVVCPAGVRKMLVLGPELSGKLTYHISKHRPIHFKARGPSLGVPCDPSR